MIRTQDEVEVVRNKTDWNTEHIRQFIVDTLECTGGAPPLVRATIVYPRVGAYIRGPYSGFAYYNDPRMTLRLPPVGYSMVLVKRWVERFGAERIKNDMGIDPKTGERTFDKRQFACLIHHESAHNRGLKHKEMCDHLMFKGDWRPHYAFADDFTIRPKDDKIIAPETRAREGIQAEG